MIMVAALLLQVTAPPTREPAVAAAASAGRETSFDGVWLDIFEGQQFVPHADRLVRTVSTERWPALAIDRYAAFKQFFSAETLRRRLDPSLPPHEYHIRFFGHVLPRRNCRSDNRFSPPVPAAPGCVGDGGIMPYEIVVTRVVGLTDLGLVASSDNPR